MTSNPHPSLSTVLGHLQRPADPHLAAMVRFDRACTELRRGRSVALMQGDDGWLIAAVETLDERLLASWLHAGAASSLLLSAERWQALGIGAEMGPADRARGTGPERAPRAWPLPAGIALAELQQLSAVMPGRADPSRLQADAVVALSDGAIASAAALRLCKRARLLPALLISRVRANDAAALAEAQVFQLDPAEVMQAPVPGQPTLRRMSDAHVPLALEDDCSLVVFRELDSDAEHVAVIVGRPPTDGPVPVRLHSACLTGDLLGSLRCDCGPQLQRAVERLAETGGVLLYLAQEGRGTGLVNKLRAYRLQDAGLDTLQADRHLGFREDERDFSVAAAMLRELGHTRIQLLTNNPQKIAALRAAGIDVVERVAVHGPVTTHNERYISTKQQAGHLGRDG